MSASPFSEKTPWDRVADGYAAEAPWVMAPFGLRAEELLGLAATARVLDVAAGPGTLALDLAARVAHVTAVDFSPRMIDALVRAAETRGIRNVSARVADGMALPFDDASFDAALSLFGLMFFSDRARGFAELLRVVRPGGRVVVSSWAPISDSPLMTLMFGAVAAADPTREPPKRDPLAMDTAEKLGDELARAGFTDVHVVRHEHVVQVQDASELWERMSRSSAPLVMLRERLGEAVWSEQSALAREHLARELPRTPRLSTTALLGVGRRP